MDLRPWAPLVCLTSCAHEPPASAPTPADTSVVVVVFQRPALLTMLSAALLIALVIWLRKR